MRVRTLLAGVALATLTGLWSAPLALADDNHAPPKDDKAQSQPHDRDNNRGERDDNRGDRDANRGDRDDNRGDHRGNGGLLPQVGNTVDNVVGGTVRHTVPGAVGGTVGGVLGGHPNNGGHDKDKCDHRSGPQFDKDKDCRDRDHDRGSCDKRGGHEWDKCDRRDRCGNDHHRGDDRFRDGWFRDCDKVHRDRACGCDSDRHRHDSDAKDDDDDDDNGDYDKKSDDSDDDSKPKGGEQTSVFPQGAPETGGGPVDPSPAPLFALGLTGLAGAGLTGAGAFAERRAAKR